MTKKIPDHKNNAIGIVKRVRDWRTWVDNPVAMEIECVSQIFV